MAGAADGVPCAVVVPDHAPETKLAAITRLGATFIKVPFEEWFAILSTHTYPGMEGVFVHPVSDPDVMAGNGTIGLEILEDLPDVDAMLDSVWRRRAERGHRVGGAGAEAPRRGSTRRRWRPRRRWPPHSRPARRCRWTTRRASWTASADARCWTRCGRSSGKLLDGSLVVSLAEIAAAVRLLPSATA